MLRLVAGLSRCLPLVIALAVLAVIVYAFLSWSKTPLRAKELMIKAFIWICGVISVASLLVSLYALLDHNTPVLELALSCAAVGVLGLAITFICRFVFRKHHPHYKYDPTAKAKTRTKGAGSKPDVLDAITQFLNSINNIRHRH